MEQYNKSTKEESYKFLSSKLKLENSAKKGKLFNVLKSWRYSLPFSYFFSFLFLMHVLGRVCLSYFKVSLGKGK